jgi:maleate isomerase
VDAAGADCVVASGTGMPTLRALRRRSASATPPALSSNLCLAWALWRAVAPSEAPRTPQGLLDTIDR